MLSDTEVIAAMVQERGVHRNRMGLLRGLEGATRKLVCLLQAELEGVEAVVVKPASAGTPTGETVRLEASVRFSTGLTQDGCPALWVSDDEDVVPVDEGEITGVAEGDATITATFHGVSGSSHVAVEPGVE